MKIECPVSAGELLDKITILRLKRAHFRAPAQRANVERELACLEQVAQRALPPLPDLTEALSRVNAQLWEVEEDLRKLEQAQEFGPQFVTRARSVYLLNDQRAALKRQVNDITGSDLVEEKSYDGAARDS